MISPDVLDRLLEVLRKRLIKEVSGALCPKCGNEIYYGFLEKWASGHVPYYEIEDTIVIGYRCPRSEHPIVVLKIPLGSPAKESKGERGGTTRLEELLREFTQKT